MKKYFVASIIALSFSVLAETGNVDNCTFNGIKLYGKVQIVNSFPDIKVKVVNSFADLKVQKVKSFADSCGKWEIVDSFPDIEIKYVNSFPGE